jgi:hypothetical protein
MICFVTASKLKQETKFFLKKNIHINQVAFNLIKIKSIRWTSIQYSFESRYMQTIKSNGSKAKTNDTKKSPSRLAQLFYKKTMWIKIFGS